MKILYIIFGLAITTASVNADNSTLDAAIGGGFGGAAGAAIGNEVGGREGAIVGGAYFLFACARLYIAPGITNAWHAFAASIVQLGLLLVAAMLDGLLVG